MGMISLVLYEHTTDNSIFVVRVSNAFGLTFKASDALGCRTEIEGRSISHNVPAILCTLGLIGNSIGFSPPLKRMFLFIDLRQMRFETQVNHDLASVNEEFCAGL